MKAYIFTEKGHIELQEVPAPKLKKGTPEKSATELKSGISEDPETEADSRAAILRPRFISPCSSDVHTVFAGPGPRREGLILGHEGIAEVVETGSVVKNFRPGDLVAVSAVMPDVPCGTGHENMHFSGTKLGRNINGMWAELFKVPDADEQLVLLQEGDISPEAALMAVDMMATGFTAAERAGIVPGDSVAVIGSGAVGLMAIAGAKCMGAGSIYCIGTPRNEIAVRMARQYGAEVYISYKDGKTIFADGHNEIQKETVIDPRANSTGHPAVEQILQRTGGEGVDRVLICGGDSSALMWASDMVKYGTGTVVNVAYIEGTGTVELPIFSLGRGMAGKSFIFSLSKGGRDWTMEMLDHIRRGEVDPAPLVTHHLEGFENIPKALEMMHERPAGLIKIMVSV